MLNWPVDALPFIGHDIAAGVPRVKPVGCLGEDIDLMLAFDRTIRPMPNVTTRPTFRKAAVVCLVVIGCGGRPSPKPVTAQSPSAQPPVAAAPAPDENPTTDSARAAGLDKPAVVASMADTVPTVVRKTFPAAAAVRRSAKPFPHQVIRDGAGLVLGYEAFSDSAGVTAKGYGGMVPVQVLFDPQGRPKRIYILDNCETPSYMDLASGSDLFQRLLAFDPARPESVDAVTLATESSRAIIKGVTRLSVRVANEIAGKPNSGSH